MSIAEPPQLLTTKDRFDALTVIAAGLLAHGNFSGGPQGPNYIDAKRVAMAAAEVLAAIQEQL
jgi:hypothetical protein